MANLQTPEDHGDLVDAHLSERALEALSGGREDLLTPEARVHLEGCAACGERAADARRALSEVSAALRVELSADALDALVRGALEAATPEVLGSSATRPAEPYRPSRRALVLAATLGALTSLVFGVLSLDGLPSLGRVFAFAHEARALSGATNQLVGALVPGGWATLALVLSVLLSVLLVPLRVLVAPRATGALAARMGTLALLVLLGVSPVALFAPRAHALDFTGDWPASERLTVVADGVPASVALERAAQAAGLGFVGALASDPPTNLRVRNASLRDVVIAVLGRDAPLVAERTATLLVVRPLAVVPAVPPTPAPASPPTLAPGPASPPTSAPGPAPAPAPAAVSASPPASDAPRHVGPERVSFGGDVIVRAGEVVESVVTMGGSATIEGEVVRDVVAMGGGVHVRRGGIVSGEIVAMGGPIRIDEGARASERVELAATPHGFSLRGRGANDDQPTNYDDLGPTPASVAAHAADALGDWLRDTLASASRHALLFLFGLLLLGLAPARLDTVTRTVAALPGRSAATGVLSAIAAVVLGVVLTITLVGIPGAIVLALCTALGVYGGLVAVAAVVGRILPIRALHGRPVLQLAAGVLVLFVVARAPLVGGLLSLVVALIGLGAVVVTRAGTRPA